MVMIAMSEKGKKREQTGWGRNRAAGPSLSCPSSSSRQEFTDKLYFLSLNVHERDGCKLLPAFLVV